MLDRHSSVASRLHALFAVMRAIVAASAMSCAIYVAGMTLLGSVVDISGYGDADSSMLVINAAGLVAGFALCRAMLNGIGLLGANPNARFGAYFGLSILTGLGMIVGFLLFIVPGIVLLIRWLPAFGFLLGNEEGAREALTSSWRRTRGHFWALLAGAVVPLLLLAVAGGSYVMIGARLLPVPDNVWFVLANLAVYACTVGWSAYGMAAYALLKDDTNTLSGVFG